MLLQLVRPVELDVAATACKQFKVEVSALMVFFVAFRDEPLIAELTSERLVTGVSSGMQYHQRLMLKRLRTVLVGAYNFFVWCVLSILGFDFKILLELHKLFTRRI